MASSPKKARPVRDLVVLLIIFSIGIASLIAGSIFSTASYTPKLGLDLEGGTQLILTPIASEQAKKAGQRSDVTTEDIDQAINIIRQRVDASGVAEAEISKQGGVNIVVSLPGKPSKETLDLVRSSAQLNFRPVLGISGPNATTSVELTQKDANGKDKKVKQNIDPKVAADTNQDGVLSEEPATKPKNNSDVAWISEKVKYDFLSLDCTNAKNRAVSSNDDPKKPLAACDVDGKAKYILGPVDVEGVHIARASSGLRQTSTGQTTNEWVVNLEFDKAGADKFAKVTQRLVDLRKVNPVLNQFAIVLDGKVVSAPGVSSAINAGRAEISGKFTNESATSLANQLNFGSLPLNFKVQSEQQISATYGSNHLEKGIWAGVIGLVLVMIYLILQYRALSVVAIFSLLVAAAGTYLTITVLSWTMGYRLSLAGVVGLIIAVGVTADSFIVYFERIRDEIRDGHTTDVALEEGWKRAKRTIIASDAVNILAAIVLYLLAVGGVQGFAFTLGLTTLIDLVVLFLFTHPAMILCTKLDFFSKGHKFSGLSPENLGVKAPIYAGRGRVRSGEMSIARRRAMEKEQAKNLDETLEGTEEGVKHD